METYYLPLIQAGFNGQGNWELAMIDGMLGIAVINQDATTWSTAETYWLERIPAYFYDEAVDGDNLTTWPGHWPSHLGSDNEPGWWGQTYFNSTTDGVSQETCRDLGHVEDGLSAAINAAETDWIQGGNLYSSTSTDPGTSISVDAEHRLIDGINTAAGIEYTLLPLVYEHHNPNTAPTNFCTSTGATNINKITPGNGTTYVIAYNEYHNRRGNPSMADTGGTSTTVDGTQNTYWWIANELLPEVQPFTNTNLGNEMTIFESLTHWVQPCQTVTNSWSNTSFPTQSADFKAAFNATASASGTSSVLGLSYGAQTSNTGLSVLIQFNPGNTLEVFNGTSGINTYVNTGFAYTPGTIYHFTITVRPPTGTFDVNVAADGSLTSTRIATNFGFRNYPGGTHLNYLTTYATTNTINLCSFNLQQN